MSKKAQPRARFSVRLPNGDFITLAIWPGKTDPTAEVINIQIRHPGDDGWETTGRLAVYRTADGTYSQLPERKQTSTSTDRDIREMQEQ